MSYTKELLRLRLVNTFDVYRELDAECHENMMQLLLEVQKQSRDERT